MISESWKPRLQDISGFMSAGAGLRVQMLRLDEIHAVISGNKWFKLKRTMRNAELHKLQRIVTFGGPYSNHLIATACAANQHGFESYGIVRGEENSRANATLSACQAFGMKLFFVSREDYRRKAAEDFVASVIPGIKEHYLIPEGGADLFGREGAGEIAAFLPIDTTHVAISVGTGTTLAGMCKANPEVHYLGYCATHKCAEQELSIRQWLQNSESSRSLFADERFGGFGKWNDALLDFMKDFYQGTEIPLDVIYTGKMMATLRMQLRDGLVDADAKVVCIHTGGLQGNPAGLFSY